MKSKQNIIRFVALFLFLALSLFIVLIDVFMLQHKIPSQPSMSGAMKALTFWTHSRAYPEKDIPANKYYKEYHKAKLTLEKKSASSGFTTTWKKMGPYNVPGRMISLAVNPQNPQTLYAGSASGGLWRTFKASTGANWHRIHTGFPVLGVMAIAFDPVDTNKIYIGTGEVYGYNQSFGGEVIRTTRGSYGIGILKTLDGGVTWVKSLDWAYHQEKGVQCIRMNPSNPRTLYAATSDGIFKTVNAGKTWQLVLNVLMGEDIVIHPDDTNKVMVSCGNLASRGSGLYRSTDAGISWTKLNTFPTFTGKTLLELFASNPNIVFASIADSLRGKGLYKTNNFGSNWTRVHNTDVQRYQGWFSHWVAVHPNDQTEVVHAGVDLYKSHNGGSSLSTIGGVHVDHHNYAHDPSNPNILYIACDGGVYRSTNFGDSYTSIGYGLQTAQFYNGFSSSSSDSNLAIGGLQDNGTNLYSGGIGNWDHVIGGDGCWTAINSINDNIIYGEWQNNNISKSENRGLSFSNSTNGMTGNAAFVAPFIISPSEPSILYSGRKVIFKTTNNANNWFPTNNNQQLDGNYALSMAVAFKNSDFVYVGTAPLATRAHIFRTTNGGDSWINVTQSLPDRYPMDIALDPNDNQTVYVVFAGFGTGHVFKTTNAGELWEDITGSLPDVPTLSVTVDPLNSDHVYVGNDLAVYFSGDGGTTWEEFNDGLPEAVFAMDLNISPANRNLRVATHGNGAYQRPLVYEPTIYLVYTMSPIPNVVMVTTGIQFATNVTNFGTQAQTELSTVKLRVLNESGTELYSNTQKILGLNPRETKTVAFTGTFSPQEIGAYEIQFINLGSFSLPKNDTTRQVIRAIMPPTIAHSTVIQKQQTYNEISGGNLFSFGDDDYSAVNLPFPFVFDFSEYDKIQICTNGWCEFGRGSTGSERGVSSAAQIGTIGANENGRMASTSRPTKALGPWWEDLNTDGGGVVSYKTIGSSPNRVFVIQWKNVRAYYDAATTTRLNFQVGLFETSNIIEYHYGPIELGSFIGGDLGAAIGFKDHIGGDYHFFDITQGGIVPVSHHRTDLNPLTDWPGPDITFIIQTPSTGINEHKPEIPEKFALYQNYPNPFNPTTTIFYDLPIVSHVSLKIYNSIGQEVRTLIDQVLPAGNKSIIWDGIDNIGRTVVSGLYFYRLEAGGKILTRKMAVVK
jgi:photosystem II stability/assembly factor-like uncharacterized protein